MHTHFHDVMSTCHMRILYTRYIYIYYIYYMHARARTYMAYSYMALALWPAGPGLRRRLGNSKVGSRT
jgi:hypothetical protein